MTLSPPTSTAPDVPTKVVATRVGHDAMTMLNTRKELAGQWLIRRLSTTLPMICFASWD